MSRSLSTKRSKGTDSDLRLVRAVQICRRMGGESRSVLALCNDNAFYVVKFVGMISDPNFLAREVLGYDLINAVGLAAPEPVIVEISQKLIYEAPNYYFADFPSGVPSGGCHFGVKFVGSPYALLTTDHVLSRDRYCYNTNDFVGMLVLDVFANTRRPRQVVFQYTGSQSFPTPYFINCREMFGGQSGVLDDRLFDGFYFDKRVYVPGALTQTIERWVEVVAAEAQRVLRDGPEKMPRHWYDLNYVRLRDEIRERIKTLPESARGFARSIGIH